MNKTLMGPYIALKITLSRFVYDWLHSIFSTIFFHFILILMREKKLSHKENNVVRPNSLHPKYKDLETTSLIYNKIYSFNIRASLYKRIADSIPN